MKKFFIIFLLVFFPVNIYALEIDSTSAIIVNRNNNEILFEKNKDDKLKIASITKVMTTIVALENIKDLDEKVVITNNDINIPYDYVTLGLKNGMEVSYNDLLYSTILLSAADSATALANHVFDNYDEFIYKMNELADKLGMNNSYFSNPVGFDYDNYSTSYDIYLLLDYALNNENFYKIYTTKKYYIEVLDKTLGNGVNHSIEKYNLDNKGVIFNGTKTGFTDLAGLCFSGITKLDNNELIIITLNASGDFDTARNIVDSINLVNYFDEMYSNRIVLEKNRLIDNIIYKDGKKDYDYKIKSTKEVSHYMDNTVNLQYLKIYYDGLVILNSNEIRENDKIGNIKIYYDDKLLASEDVLFSSNNIVINKNKKDYKNLIIFIAICIFGLFIFRKRK